MLPESRDVQPPLIPGGPKRIRSCQHLAPLFVEDLCCPSAHIAKTLLSQCRCDYNYTNKGKQMMHNSLHEVKSTIMAVLWAFMCQQSYAVHLHNARFTCTQEMAAKCLLEGRRSVAAAALRAGEHDDSAAYTQGSAQMTPCLSPHHVLLHRLDWCT